MIARGQMRLIMPEIDGSIVSPVEIFKASRRLLTYSYMLAMPEADVAAIRALDDAEARVETVWSGADARWAGESLCLLEDSFDEIHRTLNAHPRVEAFDGEFGTAPMRHAVFGPGHLVDREDDFVGATPPDMVADIAARWPDPDEAAFAALYDASVPDLYDEHGLRARDKNRAFALERLRRLGAFYRRHAGDACGSCRWSSSDGGEASVRSYGRINDRTRAAMRSSERPTTSPMPTTPSGCST